MVSKMGDSEGSPNGKLFGLPDIDPQNQGGSYKREYDFYFEHSSEETGVPFALIKAHAIMESSLNPNAFVNENPKNLPERNGWASRGLMQILWWPGSERFKKYGYSDADLGVSGVRMFEPNINVDIASKIIKENLTRCKGNLRDAINMYNTGKTESQYQAPNGYVDKVLKYYSTLIGRNVL